MNRKTLLLVLLALPSSALVFECSGDNGTGNDAGNDATNPGKDAAPDTSTTDSGSGDTAKDGQSSDGGDGSTVNLACQDPSTCDGGAVCCGTVTLNGGNLPNCNIAAVSSVCAAGAQCATALQSNCNASETIRLCAHNTDCTENAYNKCCTFQDGNQTLTFCANTGIAATADASCM